MFNIKSLVLLYGKGLLNDITVKKHFQSPPILPPTQCSVKCTTTEMLFTKLRCYTVYLESFQAETFCSKLYMQTFTKKPSQNPSYFLLNPYLNSAILNFHIKVSRTCKKPKNRKLFCFETFIVYGIYPI